MTVVAAIFFPLVLLYQAWSYRTFRPRLGAPRQDQPPAQPPAGAPAAPGAATGPPEESPPPPGAA